MAETTSRGGKGFEAVKRSNFIRVLPPPINLVDWDQLEEQQRDAGRNGQQKTLFE